MNRKTAFLMMALLLALLLTAGCASKKAEPQNSSSASNSPAAAQETTKGEPQKPVTLKLTTWNPVSQKVLDKFHEKYPYITVEWDKVFDQYREIIRTRFVSKADMDMVWLFPNQLQDFVNQDALMDLTGSPWLNNYLPSAVDLGKVNGKVYGVSQNYYAVVVFYNQDIFDKLQLSIPKNWDEFMDVSAKIKASGVAPFVFGGKDAWATQVIFSARYGLLDDKYPGIFNKFQTGEMKWNGPEMKGAYDQFRYVVEKGYALDGVIGLGYDQVAEVFKEGKAAMWPIGTYALDKFPDDFNKFKLGAFVVPVNKPDEPLVVNLVSDNVLTGVSWSKHPEEVKKFMEFIADPEIAQIWSEETKSAVTVKGGTSSKYHRIAEMLTPQVENNKTSIFPSYSPSIEPVLFPTWQQILLGKYDPDKWLDDIQKAQEKDIKK